MSDNCEKSGIGNLIRELEQEHDTVIDADTARRLQAWRGLADFLKELPEEVAETIRGEDTEERSVEELEQGLEQSIRDAAEGRTYSTEEAKEEVRKRREETSEDSTELEIVDIQHRCRCGFTGKTAKEVWQHQEHEMRNCEESDCTGRPGECDHCPEIATGDAIEEPLVRLSDVQEAISRLKEKYSKQAEEANDRSRRLSLKEGVHALTFLEEEFTQKGENAEKQP